MIRLLEGLAPVVDAYDAFIVDLWGVLHDGAKPLPGTVECLTALKAAGKRVVLLSNAPRPAAPAIARLGEIGFARELYQDLMTSGEETWRHLVRRDDPWYAALGERCYMIGPPRDLGMLTDVRAERVYDIDAADFILNTGADFGDTVETFEDLLQRARARELPMICANPDLEVLMRGKREICAGALAVRYEALGGAVRYHGKPYRSVYEACFALLDDPPRERVCAVGDSLRTDIAGAAAAGIDSILATGGIHAEALGVGPGELPAPERLEALCVEVGVRPQMAAPGLRW
ncbi:MAG TPA: TIGR01459 family HAD-type hydrolase [Candidatus Sulfotelmatobacter sp.]|nr:TIGR01459 family HAD-type hydrolase [Candidatus Sulfotelmatobacter sp.]